MNKSIKSNEHKIISIINSILDIDNVNIDSNMDNIDNWDSLNHIQIITNIESDFDIEIEFEDTLNMLSVKSILKIVSKYTNQ